MMKIAVLLLLTALLAGLDGTGASSRGAAFLKRAVTRREKMGHHVEHHVGNLREAVTPGVVGLLSAKAAAARKAKLLSATSGPDVKGVPCPPLAPDASICSLTCSLFDAAPPRAADPLFVALQAADKAAEKRAQIPGGAPSPAPAVLGGGGPNSSTNVHWICPALGGQRETTTAATAVSLLVPTTVPFLSVGVSGSYTVQKNEAGEVSEMGADLILQLSFTFPFLTVTVALRSKFAIGVAKGEGVIPQAIDPRELLIAAVRYTVPDMAKQGDVG